MKGNGTSHAEQPSGARGQCPANSPHRILVVEDDVLLRQLNTNVLLRSGYEVDAAADGAAAWEALSTDSYDLLITDNNMPKVSGVELLEKLRAARMALPVIMAAGTLPDEEFTRYPCLQPALMLFKPYTAGEMLSTVQKILREVDNPADGSQPLGGLARHGETLPAHDRPCPRAERATADLAKPAVGP